MLKSSCGAFLYTEDGTPAGRSLNSLHHPPPFLRTDKQLTKILPVREHTGVQWNSGLYDTKEILKTHS